jgi:DNA-binding CsgD family transcriptional regulator
MLAYELESGSVLFVHPLPTIPLIANLTPAEREVALLVLDGHDSATIAELRGTSVRTTANQVASIFRKVGVRSRAELAAEVYATRQVAR